MHLYAISRISDLVVLDILKQQQKHSGNIQVVTFSDDVSARLSNYGIHSQVIQHLDSGVDYYDKFLNNESPISGEVDGMPLWKVLGIDRLNFWHDRRTVDILSTLQLDSLTISFDIYDILVWQIASIAKERGIPVRAIQTHSVRERESFDLLPILPIDELVVSYEADKLTDKCTVFNIGQNRKRVQAEQENAQDETAVIFDKRDEYQFRRFLMSGQLRGAFSVFVTDARSEELYYRYLHPRIGVNVYDDLNLLRLRKRVVMFRFIEDIVYKFVPESVLVDIYDFGGINLSQQFVRDSDKNVKVHT